MLLTFALLICSVPGVQAPVDARPTSNFGVQAKALAQRISATMNNKDASTLEKSMNALEIARRACADLDVPKDFELGCAEGLTKARGTPDSYAANLLKLLGDHGHVRLLSFQEGEPTKALLRLAGSGGFNFVELEFGRNAAGAPCVVDVFSFATASSVSDSLRHFALLLASERDQGFLARLRGPSKAMLESLNALNRMNQEFAANRPEQVLAIFEKLPQEVRELKTVQVVHLFASSNLSPARHLAAYNEYRTLFPDDPSQAFLGIDAYLISEKWKDALGCLDVLDKSVGKDAYVEFMRGIICAMANNHEQALVHWEASIQMEPDLPDPYWELLGWRTARMEHAKVVTLLQALEERLQYDPVDLEHFLAELDGWKSLAHSAEFEAWKKRRRETTVGAR